jgi:hypothetical protein
VDEEGEAEEMEVVVARLIHLRKLVDNLFACNEVISYDFTKTKMI